MSDAFRKRYLEFILSECLEDNNGNNPFIDPDPTDEENAQVDELAELFSDFGVHDKQVKELTKALSNVRLNLEEKECDFTELSEMLTKCLDTKTKKKGGIFFTSSPVCSSTLDEILKYKKTIGNISILEPSIGSGQFIHTLMKDDRF